MTDIIGEHKIITKTFRFASGEVLTLDEEKFGKIPYLSAMVSSADFFESSRDQDGYYKLDPGIQYKYFSFVLESLTFHSVREVFTRLPEQNDIIPIIALLDFLGIGSQPDPTLEEVDLIFFHNLVYSPLLSNYIQIVRPYVIQDMAVQFAIAMAKEEYDFNKPEVQDQIYWFIMFILSAHKLFGPRLRYHVYKIAKHCFSIFKPTLLRSLHKLKRQSNIHSIKPVLIMHDTICNPDETQNESLEEVLDLCESYKDYPYWQTPTLQQRHELLMHRKYEKFSRYSWIWFEIPTVTEESLLEPVHRYVSEIMYEHLQSEIFQQALVELCTEQVSSRFVEPAVNMWSLLLDFPLETLPKKISNIFERESVQAIIRECILKEIRILVPTLETKHAELVKKIRNHPQGVRDLNVDEYFFFSINLFGASRFERMQEEALCYELTLDKLCQSSTIVETLHERVLEGLRRAAQKQYSHWKDTQQCIGKLYCDSSLYRSSEKISLTTEKPIYQNYRIPATKPTPKLQLKHSGRHMKNFH